MSSNPQSIFLIGPMGVGKSTLAKELSQNHIHLPIISVDKIRWDFFATTEYSREEERRISKQNGFKGVNKYWKQFEKLLVLHTLSSISTPSIIDFGAGQTVYDDPEMLKSIQEAFSDKKFVFLILPHENKEKSKKILHKRMEQRNYHANKNKKIPLISRLTKRLKVDPHQKEVNDEFIESPSNITLASHIIYTNNATPEEIAEALTAIYNGKPLPQNKIKIIKNPHRVQINQFIPPITLSSAGPSIIHSPQTPTLSTHPFLDQR